VNAPREGGASALTRKPGDLPSVIQVTCRAGCIGDGRVLSAKSGSPDPLQRHPDGLGGAGAE
jgi:hypothetical protein